jgi:RNA polymerase sigma-70 factor (ECF subfamily)
MWSVADDALLAGLVAGDPDAASAFIARFQRRVFGLALTITHDAQVAEDIAQEALLRAWRHGATYDPRRGSVTTWLLAMTHNLAIDAMRVRRPTAISPDVLASMSLTVSGGGPVERAVASDEATRLHAAMASLPEEQRRAIVLAGLLGRSGREVADHEGIPLGTAKTRIRTAMQRLRAALTSTEGPLGESHPGEGPWE